MEYAHMDLLSPLSLSPWIWELNEEFIWIISCFGNFNAAAGVTQYENPGNLLGLDFG